MSFLGNIFGSAVGTTVKDIGDGVAKLSMGIRQAITGDMSPDQKARLSELAMQADQLDKQGQVAINKIEAGSKSLFIAGWRPFIGWVCGVALAWNFVAHPIATWILKFYDTQALPPKLDGSELYPIVIGMLGLGAYRSFEKSKNVEKNR